jgi:hypothetical protein
MVEDLLLGQARGQVERPLQSDAGRDLGEQIVDRRDPDRVEHRAAIGIGC